jgi:hypothetical protein
MVMNNQRIDVVSKPGIVLPPGYSHIPENHDNKPTHETAHIPKAAEISEKIPENIEIVEKNKKEEEMKTLFERFERATGDSIGWVQRDEVKLSRQKIKEVLGFEPLPMCGYYMAIVIQEEKYASIDGRRTNLLLGEKSLDEEKYRRVSGLVIAQGAQCYRGNLFYEHWVIKLLRKIVGKKILPIPDHKKPWCRVGDFVVFPRHEGQLVNYRGLPVMMVPDTKIYSPIEHPDYVRREF